MGIKFYNYFKMETKNYLETSSSNSILSYSVRFCDIWLIEYCIKKAYYCVKKRNKTKTS